MAEYFGGKAYGRDNSAKEYEPVSYTHLLDAPVTGGDTGAREGTLTILAGGDEADFNACMPLFEAMGKNIKSDGQAGNGQHTKMCNQIAIAGAISGVCEAMVYAKATGLAVAQMVDSIGTGAAGSAQLKTCLLYTYRCV